MKSAFARTDHRPWPLPSRRWIWRQSWRELLFIHCPVRVDQVRHLVPPQLTIQEFDGVSWIGVVPFRMTGVMRRPLPDLPWISAFPELNVRLYVEADGKPGVWFLSLDATNPLAVWAARRYFHLPYHRADITHETSEHGVHYRSRRSVGEARFEARYAPAGSAYEARPGSLEHFLTERYCLYALTPRGILVRNDVHHLPWPLQPAEATISENTMLEPRKIQVEDADPILHYSDGVDVVVWSAEPV